MREIPVAPRPGTVGLCATRLVRVQDWMERYVAQGRLPWASVVVARHGEIAWQGRAGLADLAAGRAIEDDAILRIDSMSKPVTAVAALMLYEEGRFQLDDPIGRYLPELADLQVRIAEHGDALVTEPADGPVTIHHLFTHRSGFIYGAIGGDALARLYSARAMHFGGRGGTLASQTALLGQLPLHHQPGRHWSYGVSSDVLGRLVEVLSGQSFDRFLADRVFAPLGMEDTFFALPGDRQARFLPCYRKTDDDLLELGDSGAPGTRFTGAVTCFSGGGGLLSTQRDYLRFAEMLRRGGDLDGNRLLSPRTVAFMASNHLPGDIAAIDASSFGEGATVGVGYGLGVSVMLDPAAAQMLASPGEFGWGGMASTAFWVDPARDLCVVFMSQLIPSSSYPLRRELHALVQQAIFD